MAQKYGVRKISERVFADGNMPTVTDQSDQAFEELPDGILKTDPDTGELSMKMTGLDDWFKMLNARDTVGLRILGKQLQVLANRLEQLEDRVSIGSFYDGHNFLTVKNWDPETGVLTIDVDNILKIDNVLRVLEWDQDTYKLSIGNPEFHPGDDKLLVMDHYNETRNEFFAESLDFEE